MKLVIDARRPLLEGAVDFAPAGLDDHSLKEAIETYRQAASSAHGWIVGRFLCSTSSLEQLAAVITQTMQPGDRPWHVGVLCDEELGPAAMKASVFHRYVEPAGAIASIEIARAGSANALAEISAAARGISPDTTPILAAKDLDLGSLDTRPRQPLGVLVPAELGDWVEDIAVWSKAGITVHLSDTSTPTDFVGTVAAAALGSSGSEQTAAIDLSDLSDLSVSAVGVRTNSELVAGVSIRRARATVRSFRTGDLNATLDQMAKLDLIQASE